MRAYAEVNDALPPARRQRTFALELPEGARVGGLLEWLGLPLDGIELVLVDGVPTCLDQPLAEGARVSLYPMFESLDTAPLPRLHPEPLRRVRFVADAHLGRLARHLRLLGFDTLFGNDPGDAELARVSAEEGRILLSRDRALLARSAVTHGLRVPFTRPREQLGWVVERLDLYRLIRPFTRCMLCNGILDPVDLAEVRDRVPERVADAFQRFRRCRGCGRLYWEGSHYQRLSALVDEIRAGADEGGASDG